MIEYRRSHLEGGREETWGPVSGESGLSGGGLGGEGEGGHAMAFISYLVARLIVAVDENAARKLSKGTRQQTESSDPIEPSSAAAA